MAAQGFDKPAQSREELDKSIPKEQKKPPVSRGNILNNINFLFMNNPNVIWVCE